jgi:branched-subunit amino acid aminotransferase/4-amino-4-deoxychorismate lyase
LAIKETHFTVEDLYGAEEVYVASTTPEVQVVSQIEDHQIPRTPARVTRRLARAFSDYVVQSLQANTLTFKE